jgi:hypothetical protein
MKSPCASTRCTRYSSIRLLRWFHRVSTVQGEYDMPSVSRAIAAKKMSVLVTVAMTAAFASPAFADPSVSSDPTSLSQPTNRIVAYYLHPTAGYLMKVNQTATIGGGVSPYSVGVWALFNVQRGPRRPCCCSARAAPARRSPRARSTMRSRGARRATYRRRRMTHARTRMIDCGRPRVSHRPTTNPRPRRRASDPAAASGTRPLAARAQSARGPVR